MHPPQHTPSAARSAHTRTSTRERAPGCLRCVAGPYRPSSSAFWSARCCSMASFWITAVCGARVRARAWVVCVHGPPGAAAWRPSGSRRSVGQAHTGAHRAGRGACACVGCMCLGGKEGGGRTHRCCHKQPGTGSKSVHYVPHPIVRAVRAIDAAPHHQLSCCFDHMDGPGSDMSIWDGRRLSKNNRRRQHAAPHATLTCSSATCLAMALSLPLSSSAIASAR